MSFRCITVCKRGERLLTRFLSARCSQQDVQRGLHLFSKLNSLPQAASSPRLYDWIAIRCSHGIPDGFGRFSGEKIEQDPKSEKEKKVNKRPKHRKEVDKNKGGMIWKFARFQDRFIARAFKTFDRLAEMKAQKSSERSAKKRK